MASVDTAFRSKVKMAKKHSKWRAKERYGIKITGIDLNKMKRIIRNNQAESLKRCSKSRSIYRVSYRGVDFNVVYSRYHKAIITFLPKIIDFERL